jgi:hypothetical protein
MTAGILSLPRIKKKSYLVDKRTLKMLRIGGIFIQDMCFSYRTTTSTPMLRSQLYQRQYKHNPLRHPVSSIMCKVTKVRWKCQVCDRQEDIHYIKWCWAASLRPGQDPCMNRVHTKKPKANCKLHGPLPEWEPWHGLPWYYKERPYWFLPMTDPLPRRR